MLRGIFLLMNSLHYILLVECQSQKFIDSTEYLCKLRARLCCTAENQVHGKNSIFHANLFQPLPIGNDFPQDRLKVSSFSWFC